MARSAGSRLLRNLLGIVVGVVVVVMLVLLVRLVFDFFGALHTGQAYPVLVRYTKALILPIPVQNFNTPYRGTFNMPIVLTIVVLLALEFALTGLRKRL